MRGICPRRTTLFLLLWLYSINKRLNFLHVINPVLRQLDSVAALLFGLVERSVGSERRLFEVPVGDLGRADGDTRLCLSSVDLQILCFFPDELEGFDRFLEGCAREKNQKLLPAVPVNLVGGTGILDKAIGEGLEHAIAERMAVGVVDPFEMIDVEHGEGKNTAIRHRYAGEVAFHRRAVEESRQGVDVGKRGGDSEEKALDRLIENEHLVEKNGELAGGRIAFPRRFDTLPGDSYQLFQFSDHIAIASVRGDTLRWSRGHPLAKIQILATPYIFVKKRVQIRKTQRKHDVENGFPCSGQRLAKVQKKSVQLFRGKILKDRIVVVTLHVCNPFLNSKKGIDQSRLPICSRKMLLVCSVFTHSPWRLARKGALKRIGIQVRPNQK